MVVTNNPDITLLECFIKGYVKVEANQDGNKVTFASNYALELVNEYLYKIKKYKKIIEEQVYYLIY